MAPSRLLRSLLCWLHLLSFWRVLSLISFPSNGRDFVCGVGCSPFLVAMFLLICAFWFRAHLLGRELGWPPWGPSAASTPPPLAARCRRSRCSLGWQEVSFWSSASKWEAYFWPAATEVCEILASTPCGFAPCISMLFWRVLLYKLWRHHLFFLSVCVFP